MPEGFVHLHTASGYSMRFGASHPADLVQRAAELGQPALALTDRDGLYGAIRFVLACRQAGIAPILGVDLALQPSALLPGTLSSGSTTHRQVRTPTRGGAWKAEPASRVVLLARGARGWASLCRLVSTAHLSGERGTPSATLEQVFEHHDGLVALLGPQSEVGQMVARHRPDLADRGLRQWRQVFGNGRLYAEIVSHRAAEPDFVASGVHGARLRGLPLSSPSAGRYLRWATSIGLPAVLSNAVRHAAAGSGAVVDLLDAIRRLVPLDSRHLDRANGEGYLKSGAEMSQIATEVARAGGAGRSRAEHLLGETLELAQSCVLDPSADLGMDEVYVPELDVLLPQQFGGPNAPADRQAERQAADAVLRERCVSGFHRRGYRDNSSTGRQAQQRLEEELRTISTLGFAGYFLTVSEVVDMIRDRGIRVAARGSGAGSLVNHLLGISGIDPIPHGLLMERFLSPLRRALPDIDIDVESERRTEIYEQILTRFTGRRAAAVSMMDTYRVRHAVRDVGAALGLPPGEVDAFAKAFPHIRARDARAAVEDLPELRRSTFGTLARRGELDRFLGLVEALDGLPRHVALHPCGVLLSDSSLLDRTPVESSWMGFPMSQFDKDDVEEMGLLKLDVLGIRMQSAIAHAQREIARVQGADAHGAGSDGLVEVDRIPLDDPATFDLIRSTRTLGCFQIESPGQRELLGKFAPERFNDIIIDISLFRPGPVKSDMVTPFLQARHGWQPARFIHPDLKPALAETEGVVVFHEQVMQIVAIMTGCSLAQADETRRNLGSPQGQDEVRVWFYPAALRRGYSLDVVEQAWDVLVAFASFGFCKAHAAAFALPTYQSAWLKAHHPAAFLAGVLTHDPGMYPKRLIAEDARQFGVPILGVDVNRSDEVFQVEELPGEPPQYGIRMALGEVKGISAEEVARIVANRPYNSLADLWNRANPSRPVAESLIRIGALDDCYGIAAEGAQSSWSAVTRRDLLLQVAELERHSRSLRRSAGGRRAKRRTALPGVVDDPAVAAAQQNRAPTGPNHSTGQQLVLNLGDTPDEIIPSGLPEMTAGERVRAELEVVGIDTSHHVMDFYRSMLADLGVTRASDLLQTRSRAPVLVAGVKVATQTPPIRSGKRVVFLTVDDGTGPADAAFFEDAQDPYASTVFHSWTLLIRGELRRTGPRGVSLRATGAWSLGEMYTTWKSGGAEAVWAVLDDGWQPGRKPAAAHAAPAIQQRPAASSAGGMGQRRRVLVHASGFKLNVYADVKPAGSGTDAPISRQDNAEREPVSPIPTEPDKVAPSRLWHASPGSSGW